MPDYAFSTSYQAEDNLALRTEYERRDLPHEMAARWPVDSDLDVRDLALGRLVASVRRQHTTETLYRADCGAMLYVRSAHGELYVAAYSDDRLALDRAIADVRAVAPRHEPPSPNTIPVTFWANAAMGPTSFRRDLDGDAWDEIDVNYPEAVRTQVAALMGASFEPGRGGQLILWHGEPGTGKTTALRSLAREWRSWCDVHYIVDPDAFFGAHANYLVTLLIGGEDPDVVTVKFDGAEIDPAAPRWRLLILEDCGEMLAPDARQEVGQALSRLLNACDGMIGRGLRVLLLITTNEPIGKLHDAVRRPGRCAARIEFDAFTPSEAHEWLERRNEIGVEVPISNVTLAELFGSVEHFGVDQPSRALGFR